jgi:hypothetical protein
MRKKKQQQFCNAPGICLSGLRNGLIMISCIHNLKPDRHIPGLKCGYPMPCPHHTLIVVIDKSKTNGKKQTPGRRTK